MVTISIIIKPISVTKTLKKDYNFDGINPNTLVTEFCQQIVETLCIQNEFDQDDLNLMCLGKTLDHFKTFNDQ